MEEFSAADSSKKRNQVWAFIVTSMLIFISLLYYKTNVYYLYLILYIWFGFAYGLMLQYGRFCFASAFRDLFAAGVPRMLIGILIALMFFSVVQAGLQATNMSTFHPAPFGIHTFISGAIFGVGMVLAGGCASSSLYKIGEGNGTSVLAILGISFGQAIFVNLGGPFLKLVPGSWIDASHAKDLPADKVTSWFDYYLSGYVWDKPKIQLSHTKVISDAFPGVSKYFVGDSLISAIIPALILIVVVYAFYIRKGFIKKRAKQKGGKAGFLDDVSGIWNMITASKRTALMGVLIGLTAGLHIFVTKSLQNRFGITNFGELLERMGHTGDLSANGTVFDPGYWYITTQEAQLGGWVFEKLGWNMHNNIFFGINNGLPALWRNPALWMSLGIIFGSMVMALLQKEFKFKLPKGELIVWGLLGGTLMGIGARPALGCNIGAFFIRVAGGDPSGWLFGGGMAAGAFAAVKFFNWWTEEKNERANGSFLTLHKKI